MVEAVHDLEGDAMKRKPKPPLPPSCSECKPNDGAWRRDAYTGGLERCDCPRGQALKALSGRRNARFFPRAPRTDGRAAAANDQ